MVHRLEGHLFPEARLMNLIYHRISILLGIEIRKNNDENFRLR